MAFSHDIAHLIKNMQVDCFVLGSKMASPNLDIL